MPVVAFSSEPTIHNLQDAPSPSPVTGMSPQPPRSLYSEQNSLPEHLDDLRIPSLEGGLEDWGDMGEEDRSVAFDDDEEEDDEDGGEGTGDILDEEDTKPPLVIFGYTLPAFFQKRTSWNRVSARIVKYAPCFWCMGRRGASGITDWAILYRLNILCAFFAAGQVASAIWLLVVLFSPGLADRSEIDGRTESSEFAPNLWNVNGTLYILGIVGLVTVVVTLSTLRVIKRFNVVGLLRYLWAMLWILPLEILLIIGVFGTLLQSCILNFLVSTITA